MKWVDQQTWYIESRAIVCFRLLCMFRRCDWFVANQQHKKLGDIQVTAHVTFGKVDEKSTYNADGKTYPLPGFQLAVRLDVHLPGVDKSEAEKLVEQAHQVCPYSRATRNNVEVKFAIV